MEPSADSTGSEVVPQNQEAVSNISSDLHLFCSSVFVASPQRSVINILNVQILSESKEIVCEYYRAYEYNLNRYFLTFFTT